MGSGRHGLGAELGRRARQARDLSPQVLGGGGDDAHEVGLAQAALGRAAHQVALGAQVQHGRVGAAHGQLAPGQPGAQQAYLQQLGQGNLAELRQNGQALSAQVLQQGSDQEAFILQHGEDLLAVIEQVGHGNYAEIRQTGSDNQASISQYGAYNDARIEQVGDGLRSTVTQYGYGQQINIVQGR